MIVFTKKRGDWRLKGRETIVPSSSPPLLHFQELSSSFMFFFFFWNNWLVNLKVAPWSTRNRDIRSKTLIPYRSTKHTLVVYVSIVNSCRQCDEYHNNHSWFQQSTRWYKIKCMIKLFISYFHIVKIGNRASEPQQNLH